MSAAAQPIQQFRLIQRFHWKPGTSLHAKKDPKTGKLVEFGSMHPGFCELETCTSSRELSYNVAQYTPVNGGRSVCLCGACETKLLAAGAIVTPRGGAQ